MSLLLSGTAFPSCRRHFKMKSRMSYGHKPHVIQGRATWLKLKCATRLWQFIKKIFSIISTAIFPRAILAICWDAARMRILSLLCFTFSPRRCLASRPRLANFLDITSYWLLSAFDDADEVLIFRFRFRQVDTIDIWFCNSSPRLFHILYYYEWELAESFSRREYIFVIIALYFHFPQRAHFTAAALKVIPSAFHDLQRFSFIAAAIAPHASSSWAESALAAADAAFSCSRFSRAVSYDDACAAIAKNASHFRPLPATARMWWCRDICLYDYFWLLRWWYIKELFDSFSFRY